MKKAYIETPLIHSVPLSNIVSCTVLLKLELLQPSGSFKSRGLGNLVEKTYEPGIHYFSSSGGNAGLAAACAAQRLGCQCTVVVPESVAPHVAAMLTNRYKASVVLHGKQWKEADDHVKKLMKDYPLKAQYCAPFDDPLIWEGNSTIVDEIVSQLDEQGYDRSKLAAVSCSVGGGGLFNGIVMGLRRHYGDASSTPVAVTVETDGTSSLAQSVAEQKLVTLSKIESIASSLGASRVATQTFENAMSYPTLPVVVSDVDACRACLALLNDHKLFVEYACGASLAPWYGGLESLKESLKLTSDSIVVIVVCGGSTVTLDSMINYKQKMGI
ncbi:tryptophan synthase beta subunit-like PLP-dependent enzyme [Dipodascopsis uninucleata]